MTWQDNNRIELGRLLERVEHLCGQLDRLIAMHDELDRRVSKLELWRSAIVGGLAVLGGLLGWRRNG
jgi:hypothetical protein